MTSTIDSAVSSVIAAKQTALYSKIATSIASKNLQAAKQQGEAVVELIDAAAEINTDSKKGHGFDAHG